MSFQEYIEAITFMEYVRSQRILTIQQCQKDFIDDEGHQFLPLTKEDYLLGVADLTGELMRFSINSITKGFQEKAMEICQVLRDLYADFQIIHASYHVPELGKKLGVMKSSLMKVENVCYSYAIRRGEYPDEMINDMMLVNRGGNEEYEQNNDYEQRDE
ncbi:Translin family-domain-containing protein [Paraphysoderma sedebokerense]|nr:Translin family-domain-containing protein [Paraphysoderma sedebokerense]